MISLDADGNRINGVQLHCEDSTKGQASTLALLRVGPSPERPDEPARWSLSRLDGRDPQRIHPSHSTPSMSQPERRSYPSPRHEEFARCARMRSEAFHRPIDSSVERQSDYPC